jgi:hypothetical protein
MSIKRFLEAPENSHAREDILNNRLLWDLKLSAANREYHLLHYFPTVDHDGFDVVLDDRDTQLKIQLKTKSNESSTTQWSIQKGLLRPRQEHLESFGFSAEPIWGHEGGVIVIVYTYAGDQIANVNYLYTDIYLIYLLSNGKLKQNRQIESASKRVMNQLATGGSHDNVELTQGMFLSLANASDLLSLAGLHSDAQHTDFRRYTVQLGQQSHCNIENQWDVSLERLNEMIAESLARFLPG